jgi:hypothetical protein
MPIFWRKPHVVDPALLDRLANAVNRSAIALEKLCVMDEISNKTLLDAVTLHEEIHDTPVPMTASVFKRMADIADSVSELDEVEAAKEADKTSKLISIDREKLLDTAANMISRSINPNSEYDRGIVDFLWASCLVVGSSQSIIDQLRHRRDWNMKNTDR